MPLLPEPQLPAEQAASIGVLLVNLGTPDAPTPSAVRRYLREFLSDPRVVEIPRIIWWPILNGIILTTRPRQSAKKYASVWLPEGSPLKVHTGGQADRLDEKLRSGKADAPQVAWAMRYGNPSIIDGLAKLKSDGCDRILVLPLYPQFASSTTGAVFDVVATTIQRQRNIPAMRLIRGFHNDDGYIGALAASVREHWAANGRGDKLLMSFHGLPKYTIARGDPYHEECQNTARLLANALELPDQAWQISFQSRFGRTEWLQPYTSEMLQGLAKGGAACIDVICPGFVSDCLETLEEIGMEGQAEFIAAGGREMRLIRCLNERPDWIGALADIVLRQSRNWPSDSATWK